MKTTVEIPDSLFRRAKVVAAQRGLRLRDLFTEALERMLGEPAGATVPAWKQLAGELGDLRRETRRINAAIAEEFETIEPDDAG